MYWLQSITRLPIIIKGILTKEDAELAVEHGVQGIIVSNHGGRQLDGGPASVLTDHVFLLKLYRVSFVRQIESEEVFLSKQQRLERKKESGQCLYKTKEQKC